MPRRSATTNQKPMGPTAPRRRPGSNAEQASVPTPSPLEPVTALSKVLRQRELAMASRQGNANRAGRQRQQRNPVQAAASSAAPQPWKPPQAPASLAAACGLWQPR